MVIKIIKQEKAIVLKNEGDHHSFGGVCVHSAFRFFFLCSFFFLRKGKIFEKKTETGEKKTKKVMIKLFVVWLFTLSALRVGVRGSPESVAPDLPCILLASPFAFA